MRILIYAPHTIGAGSRSGVQRVVTRLSQSLAAIASVDLVKWDAVDGQLRYYNADDLVALLGPGAPMKAKVNRFAERRRYRFGDTVEDGDTWLLCPEIAYHQTGGTLAFAAAISQAREYGWKIAAIFYDLIPITNPAYRVYRDEHLAYVRELVRVDEILTISEHSARELTVLFAETFQLTSDDAVKAARRVRCVALATSDGAEPPPRSETTRRNIILLGTVEPRKRQVEVLEAIRTSGICQTHGLKVYVVGSLHGDVAAAFNSEIAANPAATYLGHASDERIAELFAGARFSIFASDDEGFGLPICESTHRGVPCLTANFGAMHEVARNGCCLCVDVRDPTALKEGILRLASDDVLVARLRAEAAAVGRRSWQDYASDIVAVLAAAGRTTETVQNPKPALHRPPGTADAAAGAGAGPTSIIARKIGKAPLFALGAIAKPGTAEPATLHRPAGAPNAVDTTVTSRNPQTGGGAEVANGLDRATGAAANALARLAASAAELSSTISFTIRASIVAAREEQYLRARRAAPTRVASLCIAISTFNRCAFVVENVKWLMPQIAALHGRVRLVVVDNASEDATEQELAPYRDAPHFDYVRNTSNLGMLGNLNVVAGLMRADYTWVIGDDDFIVPDTIQRVLQTIDDDQGVPFVFINFAVYHRVAFHATDTVQGLITDPIRLNVEPSPDGLYPVRKIAAEHDNLFTAIYPIVFRTDLLAACFNYPFTGAPFSSLVESVPTTKMILGTYSDTPARWLSEIGIVGNAHNSWTRYRVQWHGILMPLVFDLARQAGVDTAKLQDWSKVHFDLLEEAKGLFPDIALQTLFSAQDIDVAFRCFGRHVA